MKTLFIAITIQLMGIIAFANQPPANYPIVNGVVKKIDLNNNQITLKHEKIPNINMPGMTMPFIVQDISLVSELKVGDIVHFVADQNDDGDLVILWIEKAQPLIITDNTPVSCTGVAPTTPKTNVEILVRLGKYSTIRYEFAEGSYKGTAYINSIGLMHLQKEGTQYKYQAGDGKLDSKLVFTKNGDLIEKAQFYHYSSGMNFQSVQCQFEN